MRSEASPTGTGTGQDLWNHEVDRDSIRTDPRPGMLPEREPPGPQQFRQERRVAQIWRRNAEIGVGRVLGSSEVGIASVEIDWPAHRRAPRRRAVRRALRQHRAARLRARTYSGSGPPDTLVLLHPLQHLFTLRRFPSRPGQQIHDELARSDAAKTITLDRPVEGDRIERLKKHDVCASVGLAEIQAVDGLDRIRDVEARQPCRRDGIESLSCKSAGGGVRELRRAELSSRELADPAAREPSSVCWTPSGRSPRPTGEWRPASRLSRQLPANG